LPAGRAAFFRERALPDARAPAFLREAVFFFAAGFSAPSSPWMASLIRRTIPVTGLSWLSSQPGADLLSFIAASGSWRVTTRVTSVDARQGSYQRADRGSQRRRLAFDLLQEEREPGGPIARRDQLLLKWLDERVS
jgi:hypothetical protein